MKMQDFYDKVDKDENLSWGDVFEHSIVVTDNRTNNKWNIPVETIITNDWETLLDVITNKREPDVLVKMTRVVGYMSQVKNWNASKLKELEARQNGNYNV